MAGSDAALTDKWRYIRRVNDPKIWDNLAGLKEHTALKKALAEWMPKPGALMASLKTDYDFDPETYTYTLKGEWVSGQGD